MRDTILVYAFHEELVEAIQHDSTLAGVFVFFVSWWWQPLAERSTAMSMLATRLGRWAGANPMISKELRGRMRSGRSIVLLTVYLSLLAMFAFLFYVLIYSTAPLRGPNDQQVGRDLLNAIVVFETLLVIFLAPAVTAGTISGERERQTFDLLMTTLLKPRAIVLGKMGAALAFLLVLILAVAPFESLAFMIGGVAPEDVIVSLVVLVCAALLYGSVGIFWSSLLKSTAGSTVLAYGSLLLVLAGLPFIWFIVTLVLSSTASRNGGSFQPTALFIYFTGFIASTNPIAAMGLSEAYVRAGKGLFWFTDTTLVNGQTLWLPQPWLVFCGLALLGSWLLLALGVRVLPPVRRRVPSALAGPGPVALTDFATLTPGPSPEGRGEIVGVVGEPVAPPPTDFRGTQLPPADFRGTQPPPNDPAIPPQVVHAETVARVAPPAPPAAAEPIRGAGFEMLNDE